MIGATLAHYEITALLGKGGMGEVYRARDTKLGREVALKILPPEVADDPERSARFAREARTLASLQHGNIASIYGFEDVDGVRFLVMELVEGVDLSQRLVNGALPLDEALPIATQIAAGLEDAHEKGIIHRDLKPANIQVMRDGTVKILDFGLARAMAADPNEYDMANSPTITAGMTQAGVVLGTAAYMSPEQARGHEVDRRSDIWSYGCVLFEMLTGRAPFGGDTVTDVIAEIVKSEPQWDALPAGTPSEVRALLWRCLSKEPKDRLRDIGEARFYLAPPDPSASGAVSVFEPAAGESAPPRSRLGAVVAGLVLGAVVALGASWIILDPGSRADRQAIRLAFPAEGYQPFSIRSWSAIDVSPDGQTVVFSATRRNERITPEAGVVLVKRTLTDDAIQIISGTLNCSRPSFAPDGQSIAYYDFRGSAVMSTPLNGGSQTRLLGITGSFAGLDYYDEETLALVSGSARVLQLGYPAEDRVEDLTVPDQASLEAFSSPVAAPHFGQIFFTVFYGDRGREPTIACFDLQTRERTDLSPGEGVLGVWPGPWLVFLRGTQIVAQRYDPSGPALSGNVVVLASGSGPNAAVSAGGSLFYTTSNAGDAWSGQVVLVDDQGQVEPAVDGAIEYARYPRISPDGRYLALTQGPGGQGTIWRYDLTRRVPPLNLTFQGHSTYSIWSPDGSRVLYQSSNAGGLGGNLLIIPSDGSSMQPVSVGVDGQGSNFQPGSWLDNDVVVLTRSQDNQMDIVQVDLGGEPQLEELVATEFREGLTAMVSPDERWLAYVSDRSGTPEIWVAGYPRGSPQRISTGGGLEPVWSRDGSRLYYQTGTVITVHEVSYPNGGIAFSPPRVWFDGPFVPHQEITPRTYDAHPDGRLLLIQVEESGAGTTHINVVLDADSLLP